MAFTLLVLVLFTLTVARLTRLITTDKLLEPLRNWVTQKRGPDSQLTYLVHCTWCTSMWIAFAGAPFAVWLSGVDWSWTALIALAASHVTGLLTRFDD